MSSVKVVFRKGPGKIHNRIIIYAQFSTLMNFEKDLLQLMNNV